MARANLKAVKQTGPQDNHYRQALAATIERRNEACKLLRATEAIFEETRQHGWTLAPALASAQKEVAAAEQRATENRVRAKMSKSPLPGLSADEARAEVARIEAEIQATDAERQRLEAAIEEANRAMRIAGREVSQCIVSLVAASDEFKSLLNTTAVAEATHARCRVALHRMPVGVIPMFNSNSSLMDKPAETDLAEAFEAWIKKLSVDARAHGPAIP